MPLVTIFNDPAGINEKTVVPMNEGEIFMDWLIDTYGGDGFSVPTAIYSGGRIHEDNLIDINDFVIDGHPMGADESFVIVHCPQGFDPITAAYIVFVVVAVAAIALAPNVPLPENPGQDKAAESPNNNLTGQTNIARPLQRIPDIYGKNKVWPDLIAKTYTEFRGNRKFVTEYLCIGRGEYLVEEVKSGLSLIDDIDGAAFEIFGPSTAPATILDVTESDNVDGQQILAPNSTDFLTFSSPGNFLTSNPSEIFLAFQSFEGFAIGDQFTISGTSLNDGTYTFDGWVRTGLPGSVVGTVTVLESTFVTETPASWFTVSAVTTSINTAGPFPVPGGTEFVWFDLLFDRGVGDRTSGTMATITINFDLILERLDAPGGSVIGTETHAYSVIGATIDQIFRTVKIIPNFPGDPYQAKVTRTSNTTEDANYLDSSKWGRLAGVDDLGGINFGNITSVLVTTKATQQAVKSQERKFNAVVTRKLRSYDTGTNLITPTLTATTKMADAMLEHLTDDFLGNKPTAEIDLDGLYEIQDALDTDATYGDKLGRFSYSLSDRQVSVGDELVTISNAARCFTYRDGNVFRFGREEAKEFRTTTFNGRVKKPNSEKKNRKLQKPNDFDGVELQWVPEDSNDAQVLIFPEGGSPENPLKINAAGIRVYEQAWNRANVEFLKLKYVRESVETIVNKRGLLVILNDRIGNVDGTNVQAQGGELVGFSGQTIETSDPIDFKGGGTGFAIITDESGEPSEAIAATPRGDGINGFILATPLTFTPILRGDSDYQIASLYNFFIDSDDKTAKDYTIQKISPRDDGYVSISMSNYAVEIFAPDTETPTAQA
jgi:hypothetical protein